MILQQNAFHCKNMLGLLRHQVSLRLAWLFLCAVLCWLQIKRTEGVSTTDIVGRMLTCTRANPHMTKEVDSPVRDVQ
jgi:hypothetical protein